MQQNVIMYIADIMPRKSKTIYGNRKKSEKLLHVAGGGGSRQEGP